MFYNGLKYASDLHSTSYESNCFSSFNLVDIKEKIIVLLNLLFDIYKILRNKFEVSEASSARHANI